ncbi:uncharacterized protein DUF2726 [Idiomarina fontislapidosi]|uniref:DUF2726 domain-containing protein n=1 Tax=Idiomarina fontislapidosi TaxID=263723 RepID=A0A432Y289_9GAMM|nr:DUF2726 domain-containing protein [Idiomarina fontislapidosi]PYE33227.1 uncharacterized protein DUF2726 [Idiomarina fontislapidosi]RUO55070.1 hypothetical protein CWE25_06730 [Idiomarina fontislapidosi]
MEIILLLFIGVLIAVAVIASRMSESYVPYPYKLKDVTFCSAQEAQFLTLLDKAVSDDFRIFTKVRLSDIVAVKRGLSRAAQKDAQTKASQRILDYVLCDIETMEIKAVIELEPASPQLNQQKRNLFLKNALAAAGLPFLRFKAQPGYRVAELNQYIHAKIQQAEHLKAAVPGGNKSQSQPATNNGKNGEQSPIAA